ncbi:TauD/TfdA family dioxygenase [Massilia sp. CCM 8695]|uniref:TauD/TfdA family dioxygenase n=1 Tax=Massilia frigida TaxID=2609281 RepID=A0ABX0NDT2_9BURK|nr:TauD/TfdA family dioxygenase [Massilia frigida]NHZ83274.1 TauD/TfdA family dioxygenase [Massilia frigida]
MFSKINLPLVLTPPAPGMDLGSAHDHIQAQVAEHLERVGGILLRGFAVPDVSAFKDFAASFGDPLLNYEFGSTPRSKVEQGVYTSTEYPAHQSIPLHNEQAYTRQWPMRIWFYCHTAAPEGGETPIADSREVYRLLDPALRQRFIDKGLLYVRNYGNGLDVPWQQVFNTGDPAVVEAYCRSQHIEWEWKDDGELRTRQLCQAVATHPRTGETVWFNQAHLFHVSALEASVRDTLLAVVDEEDLPRHVYYGDGSPIEETVLDQIRAVYDSVTVRFPWQQGDVLMLDNMLAAHGRAPFKGARRVVVAMAQGQGA